MPYHLRSFVPFERRKIKRERERESKKKEKNALLPVSWREARNIIHDTNRPPPLSVTNQTLRRLQPRFFQPLSIAALIESRRILSSGGSTVNKDGRFFPSARTHAPPTDSIVRVLAGQTVLNSASQSDVWHGNVERCIKHAASSLFHGKRKRESALRPSSRLLSLPGERGSLPPSTSPPPPPRFYCSSNVYLSKTKGATVPTWIRLPRASRWTGFRFGSIAALCDAALSAQRLQPFYRLFYIPLATSSHRAF